MLKFIIGLTLILLAYLLIKLLKNGAKQLLILLLILIFLLPSPRVTTEHADAAPFRENKRAEGTNNEEFIVKIKQQVLLDIPVIPQFPELPRGCEVTSLAMLLNHAGVTVDKMTLAKEIRKNPATFEKKEGKIYYGHPNDGFVGDMYSFNNRGLGVYHTPIKELAETYLPDKIHDFTGDDFSSIKTHLSNEKPVWVIINTKYNELPDAYFQTWHTPSGVIDITYKEHSVLVTGYDDQYIYFNDPFSNIKNKKAPIKEFQAGWEQMGRQAITYLN